MNGTATGLGPCQVGSGTGSPCLHPATVKIEGVPFCERCAREQEAYFAVGELTQAPASDRAEQSRRLRRNDPLVGRLLKALRGMRRGERVGQAVGKQRAKATVGNLS